MLAIVFLAATVVATHNGGLQILKSSSIATLCVLDDRARDYLGPVGDINELSSFAGRLKVKIEPGNSVKLVGVDARQRETYGGGL
jgi:hypothetical protein